MNGTVNSQCSTAVSLLRGLYARVAHDLGVDVSYISRIARGERKSKVAEKALKREFHRVFVLIENSQSPSSGRRRKRIKKKARQKRGRFSNTTAHSLP
jgi:hypothetical protein